MTRSIRRHYAASGATHDVDLTLVKGRLDGHVEGRAVWADVRILRSFPGGANLVVSHDGGRARAVIVRDGNTVHVALRGRVHRLTVAAARQEADAAVAAGTELFVASPMTGVVRKVEAQAGHAYDAGDTLVVVEAMKMEFAVEAPRAVTVDEVRAKPGDRVEIGQVLVTFAAAST